MLDLLFHSFFVSFAASLQLRDTVSLCQTCRGSNQLGISILHEYWNKHKLETGRKLFDRLLNFRCPAQYNLCEFLDYRERVTLSQTCTLSDYAVKVLWREHFALH